jgi:hypothetical protein
VKDDIKTSGFADAPLTDQKLLFNDQLLNDADKLDGILPAGKARYDIFLIITKDAKKTDFMRGGVSWMKLKGAEEFQDDDEVVMAAVKQNSFSITLASKRLQNDVAFITQALKFNCFVEDHAPRDVVAKAREAMASKNTSAVTPTPQRSEVKKQVKEADKLLIPSSAPVEELCEFGYSVVSSHSVCSVGYVVTGTEKEELSHLADGAVEKPSRRRCSFLHKCGRFFRRTKTVA